MNSDLLWQKSAVQEKHPSNYPKCQLLPWKMSNLSKKNSLILFWKSCNIIIVYILLHKKWEFKFQFDLNFPLMHIMHNQHVWNDQMKWNLSYIKTALMIKL